MKINAPSLLFQIYLDKMERGDHDFAAPRLEDPNLVTFKTKDVWVENIDIVDGEELTTTMMIRIITMVNFSAKWMRSTGAR